VPISGNPESGGEGWATTRVAPTTRWHDPFRLAEASDENKIPITRAMTD
jgi:hypothetical protein